MVDVAAPGSNILSTVSYNNFAPFLYDRDRIKETTAVYGEFTGAAVTTDGEGKQSVLPARGTDYSGNAIDAADVESFGESRMLSNLSKGSAGTMELSVISPSAPNAEPFVIGNNKDTLRWSIKNAKSGDEYILYFPYEKQAVGSRYDTYSNAAVRAKVDKDGAMGYIDVCDIIVDKVDKNGNALWRTACDEVEESYAYIPVSEDWNSIWHSSGTNDALYPYKEVRGIDNTATDGSGYGFGFVYVASRDGDVEVDISSIAISHTKADVEKFGKYDVYSGTSMATPAVTGAVALIASMNPDMTADDIKATLFAATRDSGAAGKWSTNGSVDLANYSPTEDASKPAVSSVTADFAGGKVVLKGKGFGKNPTVDIHYNISGEDKTNIPCTASQGSITIGNAGAGGLGIIGSDITFTIKNDNGKVGQISKYVVKGLRQYDDAFEMPIVEEFMFFDWAKDRPGKSDDEFEEWIEEPEEPMMPSGLRYIPGANQILKYASNGTIHSAEYDEEFKIWRVVQRGSDLRTFLSEYAKEAAEKNDYWAPDLKGNENFFDYQLLANPAYMGEEVYELIRVTIDGSREAVLLLGLDVNDGRDEWTVYYDSLTGLGNAAAVDFTKYDKTTIVGYKGKIYMIGGAKVNIEDDIDWWAALFGAVDIDDKISATPYKEVYSYEPNIKGGVWTKEASLPESRMLGTAISHNGKLYYLLASKNRDEMDYSVLRFENGAWSNAGKINEAIFTGYNMSLTEFESGMFIIGISGIGIPCSVGIDDKGILLGGMSFDRSGDTFRFNTGTGKIEPLEYSLWGDLADRDVTGGSADNKFYAEYLNEVTQKAIAKSIPITSGYVKLNKTVVGEGEGSVIGGGSYTRGESSKITITPADGSYIYYVKSEGLNPDLNKEYLKPTADSKKVHTTTFNATADASLEVYFAKESTKVIMPKTSMKKRVGIRTIEAYTDGTISDVEWKSSNNKYAKPIGDGMIKFKKAGVGKTVTLTATSVENPSLQATCTVEILSREKSSFTVKGKKISTNYSVMIDKLLPRSKTPKRFKAKAQGGGKVELSWKKAKKVNGYIVFRQSGNGRFYQIGEVGSKKRSFVDRTAEKGKIYKYMVVSYKNVKDSESIRISRPSKVKRVRVR
ncbi:MAG: S8 family serine peptidase [Mogibacterium sp.]|nr:S8 family serine peptidase [Mogibacterium sp.]